MPNQKTVRKIVSRDEWLEKRKALLAKEKELTKKRQQLTKERQELPWVKLDKQYAFAGPHGKETLGDLFEGKSQLIVYHFMFQPDWDEGCKNCSLLADHYNSLIVHLNARDTNMVTVSRAPIAKLEPFRKRMGWTFKWVSSFDTDFNTDFNVYFPGDPAEQKEIYYNFEKMPSHASSELPGISVFYKENDEIFHTYSCYSRGLEQFVGVYHLLDIVPKGRDEDDLTYGLEWTRHHDKYDDVTHKDFVVEFITANSKGKGKS